MRPLLSLLLIITLGIIQGCAHKNQDLDSALGSDERTIDGILSTMIAQQERLETLQATGKFILKAPELDRRALVMRQSQLQYQRPDQIYVHGRMYAKAVLDLVSAAGEYVLVLPGEKAVYQGAVDEQMEALALAATPGELARELFFLEDWQNLSKGDFDVVATGEDGAFIELLLKPRKATGVFRRMRFEGSPWRLVSSKLQSKEGEDIANTVYTDYENHDGVLIAQTARCQFPKTGGLMEFQINTLRVNEDIDASRFDVDAYLQTALDKGYIRH